MQRRTCLLMVIGLSVAGFGLSCAATTAEPPPLGGDPWVTDAATGVGFLRIPGGVFTMGQHDGSFNEQPPHEVRLRGFLMARTEVTVAQFAKFVAETGYLTDAEKDGSARVWDGRDWVNLPGAAWRNPVEDCGDECPAGYLSWNDAAAYCAWAKMRLPTDAEWEYAAGGGGEHLRWAGTADDGELPSYAWFRFNADKRLHPVGLKLPNRFGLHDMSGNVAEWCADWYGRSYYAESPRDNPPGPEVGTSRSLRGGSIYHDATRIRVAYRGMQRPDFAHAAVGFRPVRDLPSR